MEITVLPDVTVVFLLMFARIGGLVMLMPGIGDRTVPARARLGLALLLTLVFYPMNAGRYPDDIAADPTGMIILFIGEIVVGVALGLLARMLVSAAATAGTVIAFQIGLSFSQTVDPTQGQQGVIFGSFMALTGTVLIFVLDLHHILIAGLAGSFDVFPPGAPIMAGDMAMLATETLAGAFRVGVQIAAPFIVFGLLLSLGLGVLAKLIPQMQVYFVAMPMQIWLGLLLFALLFSTMMAWYMGRLEDGFLRLLPS
jgi:flagellar biosynthetic protein FliR